jgi:glutaryl-CoA dehydrogenase
MQVLKFKGVDFIEFDSLLSDDERLVRDTARRLIEENLIPIIERCNATDAFPRTGQAHGRSGLFWAPA